MPWRRVEPMQERAQFVVAATSGQFSITHLCDLHGISRKTAYKWLGRYDGQDLTTVQDRSRAPHSCPNAMPEDIREMVLETRKAHRFWGPRKIIAHLANRAELAGRLPAASTAGDWLKQAGLVDARRRRSRPRRPGIAPLVAEEPNDLWCIDFKGQFLTGDRIWCYPLTVTDACSRCLLTCHALPSTDHHGVQQELRRLFADVGMPRAIRSDNGCPFCSLALNGLSRLSVWWIKLGIAHQRIRPGKPQENGRHERMHRTLKAETARPPAENAAAQQRRFDQFRREYNEVRPHEAIDMRPPMSVWRPSPRPLPQRLPGPEYEGYMQVRSVRHSGEIKFAGSFVFVSQVLTGERIALEEVDDGIWHTYFYDTLLAALDQRTMRLTPIMPRVATPGAEPRTPGLCSAEG